MALRGQKITWVCIAILFLSCYFQNTFPFVFRFRQTDDIRNKRRKKFVEQGMYIKVKIKNIKDVGKSWNETLGYPQND